MSLSLVSFWFYVTRENNPTLIFDSKIRGGLAGTARAANVFIRPAHLTDRTNKNKQTNKNWAYGRCVNKEVRTTGRFCETMRRTSNSGNAFVRFYFYVVFGASPWRNQEGIATQKWTHLTFPSRYATRHFFCFKSDDLLCRNPTVVKKENSSIQHEFLIRDFQQIRAKF